MMTINFTQTNTRHHHYQHGRQNKTLKIVMATSPSEASRPSPNLPWTAPIFVNHKLRHHSKINHERLTLQRSSLKDINIHSSATLCSTCSPSPAYINITMHTTLYTFITIKKHWKYLNLTLHYWRWSQDKDASAILSTILLQRKHKNMSNASADTLPPSVMVHYLHLRVIIRLPHNPDACTQPIRDLGPSPKGRHLCKTVQP